jgi:hypothetical protein
MLCVPSQNWPAWESKILPLSNSNIDSKEHAHASLGGSVCKRDTTERFEPSGDLLITRRS